MQKPALIQQRAEMAGGYSVFGTRYGTAEKLEYWHIFSRHRSRSSSKELIVVGGECKPARSTVYENGVVSVRAVGNKAELSSEEKTAILSAIAHWEHVAPSGESQ